MFYGFFCCCLMVFMNCQSIDNHLPNIHKMCDLVPTCQTATSTTTNSTSSVDTDASSVFFESNGEFQMQVIDSIALSLSPVQSFFNLAYISPQQLAQSSSATKSDDLSRSLGFISLVNQCAFVTETHPYVPIGSIALSKEQCKSCKIGFNTVVSVKISEQFHRYK